jgi:chromosome segregation ATPase
VSDVLTDLQSLKREVQDAERRRAKRDADIDNLEARLRDNLKKLETYGVKNVEEGRALLTSMEKDLQANIDTLRETLRKETE